MLQGEVFHKSPLQPGRHKGMTVRVQVDRRTETSTSRTAAFPELRVAAESVLDLKDDSGDLELMNEDHVPLKQDV